jgi:hypothetical protein
MKTKKVIDWMKYKNYKDHSRNFSALTGLQRVNKILGRGIKLTISGLLLYIPYKIFAKDVEEVLSNGANEFYRKLENTPKNEKIFHNSHYKSVINFIDENVNYINTESR